MSRPTLPSLLCSALHLNNQAATHIVDGGYENAVSILTAALVQLKQTAAWASSGEDCHLIREMAASPRAPPTTPLIQFLIKDSHSSSRGINFGESSQDGWYLHRHPIQLISTTCYEIQPTSDIIELISFAAIYNMGLCHHLQAISLSTLTIDSSRQHQVLCLTRATAFYEHAQRLLLAITTTNTTTTAAGNHQENANTAKSNPLDSINNNNHMMTTRAFLGIANNLGHAHYVLGNERYGKLWFQRLWNAIRYLSSEHDNNNNNSESETIQSNDKNLWGGLLENITLYFIGTTSHAPAA